MFTVSHLPQSYHSVIWSHTTCKPGVNVLFLNLESIWLSITCTVPYTLLFIYNVPYYFLLVLTKQVDSTFRVLRLVHQTRYILGYSPPDEIFKMAARFATVTEEETRQMNEEATPANTKSTCLVNTKTTIPLSVGD